MTIETVTNITVAGCFICLVICVSVQTLLKWYEDICKDRWMGRYPDLVLMEAAVTHLEQAEETWQRDLDKQV